MPTQNGLRGEHNRVASDFQQIDGETVGKAWIRMKEHLEYCWNHDLQDHEILQIFYYGLNNISKDVLNNASGKNFFDNSVDEAFEMLENEIFLSFYEIFLETNEFVNDLQTVIHQRENITDCDFQKLEEKLLVIETKLKKQVNPPKSTWDDYISDDDDVVILSGDTYYFQTKDAGTIDEEVLIPEPVEEEKTLDEQMEELLNIVDGIWGKFEDDDDTLDKELEELLSSDLGEVVENGKITAEEFNDILEMSIDEFEQWMENLPFIEQNKETKTSLEDPSTDSELTPLPSNLERALLQGESLLPVLVTSLLPVMIQTISNVLVVSVMIQTYNETVSRKRKLEETLNNFLIDKCSNFERGVINEWIMKDVKIEDYSPFNVRPPDISKVGVFKIPSHSKENLEKVQKFTTQKDVGEILTENLLKEFNEPGDILWNKFVFESESEKISFKKLKGWIYHVPQPPDQNNILCHLWVGNLFAKSTHHHCHSHLNSRVGEEPLDPCK